MVNLRNGDTLRFGQSVEHPNSSGRHNVTSSSTDASSDRNSDITLPVVGHRIIPKNHRERFARPSIVNQRLCKLRDVPRLVDAGKSLSQAAEVVDQHNGERKRSSSLASDGNNNVKKKQKPRQKAVLITSESEHTPPNRLDRWTDLGVSIDSNSANGNQLVQQVVNLQNKLHRKELEIAQLKERLAAQQALPQIAASNTETSNESTNEQTKHSNKNAKQIVYDTFFDVSCKEIEYLGQRFYRNQSGAMRDYSDVFNEAYRLLQEPFSFRLMEINTKCCSVFKRLQISADEKEQLYTLLDEFFRDKLNPISKAFDAFLPILKESTGIARTDVRACAVFSQWSREFGDQLQLNPNSEHMAYKVDDLQARFREHNLAKHWLPSSISPVLKILIYEFKTKVDELARKEKEVHHLQRQLTKQNARAEAEQNNPLIVQHSVDDDEMQLLRNENEALRSSITLLEQKLHQKDSEPSSEEAVESDDEVMIEPHEAHAEKAPDLENNTERSYDEQSDHNEVEPEISSNVTDLPQLDSPQEGVCSSKGEIREERNESANGSANEGQRQQNQAPSNGEGNDENSEDENNRDVSEKQGANDDHSENNEDNEEQVSEEHREDEHFDDTVHSGSHFDDGHSEADLESDIVRKNTRATEADIDETILDQQVRNRRPISAPHESFDHGEREQNAAEFWTLAHMLAKALNVDLPDHDECDFSSIDLEEGTNVEKHRREIAINSIMDKIRDILNRIRDAEATRIMPSRQQSVRSDKSNNEEHSKARSASAIF
ncbi:FHA domain-containing protein [Aphelenchoides bicaudatus]|nr:FHA domain-containing protein [Aphelenchoides bicaudatus]